MAIDANIENEYGANFTYHKLRDVRIINDDNIGIQLTMTVQSWINKEARINGKQPTVRQCIISGADFAMFPFYSLLKAKFEEFAHGVDDYDNSFKEVLDADGKPVSKAPANYTVQTAQGGLVRRWIENAVSKAADNVRGVEDGEPAAIDNNEIMEE